METVAGFLKELKSSLSDEAFQTFKTMLRDYKEVHDQYTYTRL